MGRRWVRGLGVVDDAADLREMEGGEHLCGPCYLAGCWVGAEGCSGCGV